MSDKKQKPKYEKPRIKHKGKLKSFAGSPPPCKDDDPLGILPGGKC